MIRCSFSWPTQRKSGFPINPNASLIKLRLLGEALAQHIALRCGILFDESTTQADLLFKIEREFNLDQSIRSLFHVLRVEGNKAAHDFRADIRHRDAMNALKVARDLAVWFHRAFGKAAAKFNPGPFVPPQDPSQQLRQLHDQITQLQAQLEQSQQAAPSLSVRTAIAHHYAVRLAPEARPLGKVAEHAGWPVAGHAGGSSGASVAATGGLIATQFWTEISVQPSARLAHVDRTDFFRHVALICTRHRHEKGPNLK